LSQDDFLIRHDLTTLEALLVLIYAISHNEGVERGWVLLGSALNIGIATRCNTPDIANLSPAEVQRRRRCWAGILVLYTYQGLQFRDINLSFLLAENNAIMPVDAADEHGKPTSLTDFKIRMFKLSNQICSKLSTTTTPLPEASLSHFDEAIAQEQAEWDTTFLVNGAPSVLDTASYAHWCVLQTYAHQLYLLLHRPFHRRHQIVIVSSESSSTSTSTTTTATATAAPFRASSRVACLRSSAALLDLHRQFCELPRLRSYRWVVHGMTSFNALQGAAALASCLLDYSDEESGHGGDPDPDPRAEEYYKEMLAAVVKRVEGLRDTSPVCARAFPLLRHLQ
jgi:hypothetical protein